MDLGSESDELFTNINQLLNGRPTVLLDLDQLIGVGGESLVVAMNGQKSVIKIVEVMESVTAPDNQAQAGQAMWEKDGKAKQSENQSTLVKSSHILTPTRFVLQYVKKRTYYVFRKLPNNLELLE